MKPCIHRGHQTRLIECEGCKTGVFKKVFACAIHSECTATGTSGIVGCKGCTDDLTEINTLENKMYTPKEEMLKDLLETHLMQAKSRTQRAELKRKMLAVLNRDFTKEVVPETNLELNYEEFGDTFNDNKESE